MFCRDQKQNSLFSPAVGPVGKWQRSQAILLVSNRGAEWPLWWASLLGGSKGLLLAGTGERHRMRRQFRFWPLQSTGKKVGSGIKRKKTSRSYFHSCQEGAPVSFLPTVVTVCRWSLYIEKHPKQLRTVLFHLAARQTLWGTTLPSFKNKHVIFNCCLYCFNSWWEGCIRI